MKKVRVSVELPDANYQAFVNEGKRQGVSVEQLVQQTVQGLLRELELEESEGTDHLIIPS